MRNKIQALALAAVLVASGTYYAFSSDRLQEMSRVVLTAAGSIDRVVKVTGDTYNRFTQYASGQMEFGSGSATPDTNLYRSAADTLATDDSFNIVNHDGSATGLKLGSTLVTATAAELNRANDVSARMVTLSSSTSIDEATHEGKTLYLTGTGAAKTMTLPAATGSGDIYRFVVGAVNTSNHVISASANSGVFYGNIITNSTSDSEVTPAWAANASSNNVITLNGTTTGGAKVGDVIVVQDVATNKWFVSGFTTSSGAEATPFSG